MANSNPKGTKGNKVYVHDFCIICGKPCRGVDFVNRCSQTGRKGTHWVCEDGHYSTIRKHTLSTVRGK
jgi:hypothetical protein